MPELPEVETVVRDLRPHLVGKRIVSCWRSGKTMRRAASQAADALLDGARVSAVERRGKWILVRLESGATLVVHLGMTGQLRLHEAESDVESHTHLRLELTDNQELRFRDIRRFGSATAYADNDCVAKLLKNLGPEPFDVPPKHWRERLAKTDRVIKAVLLDQRFVAGVGNIYADESLHRARLNPARVSASLTRVEADRLRKSVSAVLLLAINARGSSIRDYVGGFGLQGGFQHELQVYGRTGSPCRRCKTPIERVRLAGRSTHYCPACQRGD